MKITSKIATIAAAAVIVVGGSVAGVAAMNAGNEPEPKTTVKVEQKREAPVADVVEEQPTEVAPEPVVEPAPAPVVEPAPAPVPPPAPAPPKKCPAGTTPNAVDDYGNESACQAPCNAYDDNNVCIGAGEPATRHNHL